MKKIIICTMAVCMSFTFFPTQSSAAAKVNTTLVAGANATESATANALITRLHEIKAMDMSTLSAPEKKSLRKEVRTIKQQLSDIGGGVYISAGAIILILILLIILL